jgi:hypothetical protein
VLIASHTNRPVLARATGARDRPKSPEIEAVLREREAAGARREVLSLYAHWTEEDDDQ